MKIGIFSDTHDNLPLIREAINIFNSEDVELVIHCGDFVSLFVVKEFKELGCPILAVYGNNDGEKAKLREWLKDINKDNEIDEFLAVEIDDLKFFITHGHYNTVLDTAINSGLYDIVVYGHTHKKVFESINNTLVINPGECCGYLTGEATIGILDTKSKEYKEYRLGEEE
ncbi:MJ0936 family phosphodiesterase [Methanocaldococcus indicus]|uniref:MJ0936 family phosphodiesterase n=1 Tax=Methanocaldococcus indicus TaxID=213231 RepID=UPI003C6D7879